MECSEVMTPATVGFADDLQHPDTIGIVWPIPLERRSGLPGFTGAIEIYFDFQWEKTIGHCHGKFKNGKRLSERARNECPRGKAPALLLTSREDITNDIHETETHRVVIVNVTQMLQAKSETEFFVSNTAVPLTELTAIEDRLAGVATLVRESPELAFRVEQIARDAARRKGGEPAEMKRALGIIESLESIREADAQSLVTLLKNRVPDGEVEGLLDTFLDVDHIANWLKVNPQRHHDLAKLLERSGASFATISGAIEFVLANPDVQPTEIRRVLEALPHDDVAVREYLRKNMSIVKSLAEKEYTESDLQATQYRREQLGLFKRLVNNPDCFEAKKHEWKLSRPESVWQEFFQQNQWIFGYGLRYVFMTAVDPDRLEQTTTGSAFDQAGKRPDALMRTTGKLSHLCFVEIKMHDAPLLKPVANPYRSECWSVGDEITGGIVQVQQTIKKATLARPQPVRVVDDRGDPTGEELFLDQPKGILVVGNLAQFTTPTGTNWHKTASFELFRRNLSLPEVLTYDELLARAEHIVENRQKEVQGSSSPKE